MLSLLYVWMKHFTTLPGDFADANERLVTNTCTFRVPHRRSFGKDATEGESYVFFHVIDSRPRARQRAVYL